jgi:hypothetical protein
MSLFEDSRYRWRETYFVLFDRSNRPSLQSFERMMESIPGRFELTNSQQDAEGLIESATILSPGDFAALDVSFIGGEEVVEQTTKIVDEVKPADADEKKKLARLAAATGRLDVMHFERISGDTDSDEPDEMFDPSALLILLDHLIELTDGVAFDPQAGVLV